MQFTKTSTTTYKADWILKDFILMTESYRTVRAKSRSKMDRCIKCGHKFVNGEMMGLGCFGGKGNKVICGECADNLLSQDTNNQQPTTNHKGSHHGHRRHTTV